MHHFNRSVNKIGALMFILLMSCLCTSVYSKTLIEVYSQATQHNLSYRSHYLDYKISQERLNELAAGYDANLSLTVNPELNFKPRMGEIGKDIDLALSFSKPLYQKELDAKISQANAVVRKERVVLEREKQRFIARLATLYLSYASAQNKLDHNLMEQNLLRQTLKQTQKLLRSQLATNNDVNQAKILLNQSYQSTYKLNYELQKLRKDLHIETGVAYSNLAEIQEGIGLPRLRMNNLNRWIELANSYNHELLMARLEAEIQSKGIKINQQADSTSIDLFASYGLDNESDDTGGKLGLAFNVPLYSGDRDAARVRSAKLEYHKASNALQIKRRAIAQEIKLQLLSAISGLKSLKKLSSSIDISKRELTNIKRSRKAGMSTVSDVLLVERDLLRIKRSYNGTKYQFLIDIINLRLLAGVLSVDDLTAINSLFVTNSGFKAQAVLMEDSFVHGEVTNGTPVYQEPASSLEDAWGIN